MVVITSTCRVYKFDDKVTAGGLRDVLVDTVSDGRYKYGYDIPRDAVISLSPTTITFTWDMRSSDEIDSTDDE